MKKLALAVLVASAVVFMWFPSYTTRVGLTPSTLLALCAIYIAILGVLAQRRVVLVQGFTKLLFVSVMLIIWAAFIYAVNDEYQAGIRRLMQMALGIGVAFAVYVIMVSSRYVMLLICGIIIGAVVSAMVGIGQWFIGEPFISLWLALVEVPEHALRTVRLLVPGLAPTSILLGYQLTIAIPLAVALFVSWRGAGSRARKLVLAIAIAIMSLAVVLTGSRSAVGAALLGVVFVMLLLHGRRKRGWMTRFALALSLGALLYIGIGYLYAPSRFVGVFVGVEDISVHARLPIQVAAIQYAMDHPFGTGIYHPVEKYLPWDIDPRVAEAILRLTPHNQFLNVLVYYGFPGLALLIAFYWLILKQTYGLWQAVAHRAQYDLLYAVAGLAGALLAYLVNSLFHNAGPFVGDRFHWYLIGLMFSVQRLVLSQISGRKAESLTNER